MTPSSAAPLLPSAVTVVVTVWGEHVRHLPGTLASICAQGGVELSVVLVDNASDEPVTFDPSLPVRLVRSPVRLGPSLARNLGLEHVTTPLVCFADADDLLVPGFLAAAAALLADPSVVVAGASLQHVDGETLTPTGASWPPREVRLLARWPRLLASVCLVRNCVPVTGGAVCRTDTLRALGGFGDVLVDDDWTLSALLPLEGRVVVSAAPGVLYRVWPASLSRVPRPDDDRLHARTVLRARFAAHPSRPWWTAPLLHLARWVHERGLTGGVPAAVPVPAGVPADLVPSQRDPQDAPARLLG